MLQNPEVLLPLLIAMVAISTVGLFKLNMHLGKPHRFYRGFNNLRLSPVSREIAGVSLFYTGLLGYTVFALFDNPIMQIIANSFAFVGVDQWYDRLVLYVQACTVFRRGHSGITGRQARLFSVPC